MVEVTDIDGIGPSTAEELEELGYDSVEDLADGDADDLTEINLVSEDKAKEFIVEAQTLVEAKEEVEEETGEEFDLKPADVSDEVEPEDEDEEEDEEDVEVEESDDDEVEEEVDEEPDEYTVSVEFSSRQQYDTFHAALMRYHEDIYTSNQPQADVLEHCLDNLTRDGFEYELDEHGLNTLHTAIKQYRIDYQSRNMVSHMDALKEVEQRLNDARRNHLF